MEVAEEIGKGGRFECGAGQMYTALDHERVDLCTIEHNVTGMVLIQG